MAGVTTVVVRSIDPPLRRLLTLFLTEVAPLTFSGRLPARVRDKLWDVLSEDYAEYEATMVVPASSSPTGIRVRTNEAGGERLADFDGLTLSVRRHSELSFAEQVLAKSAREYRGEFQPEHRLILHLLDSAAAASVIWDTVLSEQQRQMLDGRRDFVVYAAGMHDIGKCSPHWQRRVLGMSAVAGVKLPEQGSKAAGQHDANGGTYFRHASQVADLHAQEALAVIAEGHHGHFKTGDDSDLFDDSGSIIRAERLAWAGHQNDLESLVAAAIGADPGAFSFDESLTNDLIMLVTGVVILADWIASDAEFIRLTDENATDYPTYFQRSLGFARDSIRAKHLTAPVWNDGVGWDEMFPDFTPNDLQASLIENLPNGVEGLLLISAPPGAGKSKAALYAAARAGAVRGAGGITFCLPTRATTNAMFDEATGVAGAVFGGSASVALRHSSARTAAETESIARRAADHIAALTNTYSDDEHDLFINEFLASKSELGGMSHISVETIDQLISAATRRRHNPLRWLAATGRVVILDEIHDFDAYTFSVILDFIRWCGAYRVPVIAMSATLSGVAQRQLVAAYTAGREAGRKLRSAVASLVPDEGMHAPGWVHVGDSVLHDELPVGEHVPYLTRVHSTGSFVQRVVSLAAAHAAATRLVVCHTVDQAVRTYDALAAVYGPDVVALLHSRMSGAQKTKVTDRIYDVVGKVGQREPFILVATQIVQQSFDFDFDVLITAAADLPELIQRFGRVHRHNQDGARAVGYEGAPVVEIVAESGIIASGGENIDEYANSAFSSLVPYVLSPGGEWGILATLEVLRRLLPDVETTGALWDAKGETLAAFREYVKVCSEADAGDRGNLSRVRKAALDAVSMKSESGSRVTIAAPDDVVGRNRLTSRTRGSKEAPTRAITHTDTVLIVHSKGGRRFFDARCTVPFDPFDDKAISNYAFSLTRGWMKAFEEHGGVLPRIAGLPSHVTAVDARRIIGYATVDDVRGLVRQATPNRRYVWL